ncbi:integrase, catalytic region, zinc finger, CCHC-type containing protein [Tanacetum coccineum]
MRCHIFGGVTFGALCYPTNDSEDLGKFQAKADIGIFVGYAPSRKGYRIYNKRTCRLMKTIHVTFDEMHQSMAPARVSFGPEPFIMTPGQLKSGLAPTDKELEMLFQPMFDEHLEQSRVNEPVPSATEINAQVVPPGTSLSTTIAQDAPSTSASSSTSDIHNPVQHQEIEEEPIHEDTPIIYDVLHPSHNHVSGDPGSAQSSSGNVNSAEPNQVNYHPDHLRRWTKDHPPDNIVGNPSRPVSTINQKQVKASDACGLRSTLSVQPEDLKTRKIPTPRLSSEESSLWAKTGTKGVMSSKFQMSILDKWSFFLGQQVFSSFPEGIFINQAKYALETLKKYGMDLSDPVDTPMVDRLKLDEDLMGIPISEQSLPIKKHFEAIKRVFRYLKGTINMGLWYPKDNAMSLTAYADANHAGCQDSRRSTSGSAQFLENRLVTGHQINNEARQYHYRG